MKFVSLLPIVSPRGRTVIVAACITALLAYGFYFIDRPSRIYTSHAIFRYYADSEDTESVEKQTGSKEFLLDYFLAKTSINKQVASFVKKRTGIAVSEKDVPRYIYVRENKKAHSLHVRSFHENPRVALVLVKSFVSALFAEVEKAEVGDLRKVRRKVEKELEHVEGKLMEVKTKLQKNRGKSLDVMQEKIKLFENAKQQAALKKAEAEGVLSRLLQRLRKESPSTVSGTTVNVNPAYKDARFKLLDLQEVLRKKKEDGKILPDEIHRLELQVIALNNKISRKIPKYIEVPTVGLNLVYEFLSQKVVQQRISISSLESQIQTADEKLKELKKEAELNNDKNAEFQKDVGESERLENQIYLLQGALVDLKLEEFANRQSLMLISQSRRASVLKPRNKVEISLWVLLLMLTILYAVRFLLDLRKGILDFHEMLQTLQIPVLASHSGLEKNNVFAARALAYICHEMPFKTLLFLSCSPQVSSSVIGDISVHLSQKLGKVLLVDADIYRPSLHGFFESRSSPGLLHILAGGLQPLTETEESFVKEIEKHITPITSECGFMAAGLHEAGHTVVDGHKIKKEHLERFFNVLKTYDVMVAFYAGYEGNEGLLTEFIPFIEGIMLCCPVTSEVCAYHRSQRSFLEKYQHKILGSIIFERNAKELSVFPAAQRVEL